MLRSLDPNKFDIALIQEPVLNKVNLTMTNPRWNVIYPSCHNKDCEARTRSVILINKNISKDVWRVIPTHSPDVTALEIKGDFGKIQIYNVYNDGTHNKTLENLDNLFTELDSSGNETHANGILLMGDFNRHHPMWDEPRNQHLFTAANLRDAQPLLDLLVTYDLIMALPEGIPTLEANGTGNHTRPDNVFARPTCRTPLTYVMSPQT